MTKNFPRFSQFAPRVLSWSFLTVKGDILLCQLRRLQQDFLIEKDLNPETLSCWIPPSPGEIVNFTPLILQFPCLAQGPIPMGEADDMSITSSSLVLQLVVLCSAGFSDNIRLCFASSGAKPMLNGPGNRDICPPPPPRHLSRWPSRCCKSPVCPGGQLGSFNWLIH